MVIFSELVQSDLLDWTVKSKSELQASSRQGGTDRFCQKEYIHHPVIFLEILLLTANYINPSEINKKDEAQ